MLVIAVVTFAAGPGGQRPADAQVATQATRLSISTLQSCTILTDGALECWGYDLDGRATDAPGPFVEVVAGTVGTCALTAAGAAVCAGDAFLGTAAADRPGPYEQLALGYQHVCGLVAGGAVDCWGENEDGQATDQPGPYTAIGASGFHTCGLTPAGAVECWGAGSFGEADDQPGPYTAISTSWDHSCGLTPAGAVECWGSGPWGEAADQAGPFSAVSAGVDHSCALTATGDVECWGRLDHDAPGSYTAVSAGGFHTCALRPDGTVACWGTGSHGQMGTGPFAPTTLPGGVVGVPYDHTVVAGGNPASSVAVSGDLPPGLSFDAATGAISGTPTESGTWLVAVRATSLTGSDEATDVALVVGESAQPVSGSATGPGATPLEGATVAAFDDDDGWIPTDVATTGADGRYQLTGLATDAYRIAVVPPDDTLPITWYGGPSYVSATPVAVDASTGATGIDVALVPAASMQGTVMHLIGDPLDKVQVAVFGPEDTWLPTRTTTTAADGTYLLEGLPPGTYRVAFRPLVHSWIPLHWYSGGGCGSLGCTGALHRSGARSVVLGAGTTMIDVDVAVH